MRERRQNIRWQVNRSVKARLEGAYTDTNCVVQDLNFTGVRVSLAQKLPPDKLFKVKIRLSDTFALEVEVWVAWHRREMEKNVYGLYFTMIKDTDKEAIYKFMRSYSPEFLNNLVCEIQTDVLEEKRDDKIIPSQTQAALGSDRRIFERVFVDSAVKLINLDRNEELDARAYDISANGLGVITKKPLIPGDNLELWVDISDNKEPLYTRGRAVWSKPQREGTYKTGVFLEKAAFMGVAHVFKKK